MKYPSTIQYIETLLNPQGLFRTIDRVLAITDYRGEPLFCSGNFGVVFQIQTNSGMKALKCFTRAQAGRLLAYERIAAAISASEYIVDYRFLDSEIYVFDDAGSGSYYPVLMMDWVNGTTLSKHIEMAVSQNNMGRIAELAEKFDRMSAWLLEQSFAHNDLKPDNIMVRQEDDRLVLIDYDGMFVESMSGEAAREFGTEPFQSPFRRTSPFDRNVDNYSIAYIKQAFNILKREPNRYCADSMVNFTATELSRIQHNHVIYGSEYQFLGDSISGIRLYKENEKYGFIKSCGTIITQAVFNAVQDFGDGLAAVSYEGKWGYIDSNGNVVISFLYDECTTFGYGFAAVCNAKRWWFIDINGKRLARTTYDNAWTPRHGFAMVCNNGKYGFVGPHGKVVISLKYDFAQNFTDDNLACVRLGNKYGFIDTKGKWYIEPKYDYACNFHQGKALVELDGKEFEIFLETV